MDIVVVRVASPFVTIMSPYSSPQLVDLYELPSARFWVILSTPVSCMLKSVHVHVCTRRLVYVFLMNVLLFLSDPSRDISNLGDPQHGYWQGSG